MSTNTEIEIKFRDPDASNDAKSIRKNGGVPGVLYSSEEDLSLIHISEPRD